MTEACYTAAWVPDDDPERSWDDAADLAVEWQREQLERIHWYGNNGWATGFGKDQTTRVLTQMKQHGLLDTDVVLGHMVAKDHHGKAVERLTKIIDKLS